ncbi:MAG: nitroreductase family protein [bacterium]|nr:nitroreductase family protein [bacterium]
MDNNINQIIRERRSHYPQEFTGALLDDNIINTLIENACWAPNHTLNFPWRFIVLKETSLSKWLQQVLDNYIKNTPAEKFSQKTADKIQAYQKQVSQVIVLICEHDSENANKHKEDLAAVACGVENMYLSLSQFPNAAGYWSTGMGTYGEGMHAYFELKSNQELMGFFMLGSVDKKRTESSRKDYKQFILG